MPIITGESPSTWRGSESRPQNDFSFLRGGGVSGGGGKGDLEKKLAESNKANTKAPLPDDEPNGGNSGVTYSKTKYSAHADPNAVLDSDVELGLTFWNKPVLDVNAVLKDIQLQNNIQATQVNTSTLNGISATVLAFVDGATSNIQAQIDANSYAVNAALANDWYTFQADSPINWSVSALAGVASNGNSILYSAYIGANQPVKAVEALPSGYGTPGLRSVGSTSLTRFKWRCSTTSTTSVGAIGFTASSTTGIYDVRTSVNIGVRFVFDTNSVYASVGNGSTNSNTLLTGVSANVWHTYEMIWTSSTEVQFYIDGTLVHTQSSGLPTPAQLIYFAFGVNSAGDGSAPNFRAVGTPIFSIKTA